MLLIKSSRRKDPGELIVDVLMPAAEEARDWAVPHVEAARDWAVPHVEAARGWVEPRVEPVLEEARLRGSAAVAALRGDLDPPREPRHRLRKLLVIGAVVVAAVLVWKRLSARRGEDDTSPWATPLPEASLPDEAAPDDDSIAEAASEAGPAGDKA